MTAKPQSKAQEAELALVQTPVKESHHRITPQIVDTMKSQDTLDPVGRQYLYSAEENNVLPEERFDPIGDFNRSPVEGLVHRYPDRVLLKITDICAVYCRFCFRKEMVGKGKGILSEVQINDIFDYIQKNPNIEEVILSGGDPLTLSNRRLADILNKLSKINHIQTVRFHTRAIVVTPDRINAELIEIFQNFSKTICLVVHVNHANEINDKVKTVFRKLSHSGSLLLSQSVLLKGVNDNVTSLETLFKKLIACGVKPYYLHHPDLAPGTKHFRLSIKTGQKIYTALRHKISGICVPDYVLDIPGGYGKVPLNDSYVTLMAEGHYLIEDSHGQTHHYKDI